MLASPHIELGPCRWTLFQICGIAGYGASLVLSEALALHTGLSTGIVKALAIVAIATFLGVITATKILVGEERIIYYHHEIGIVLISTVFLWAAQRPLLPYLDIVILGIGTFLACGRIGCLLVGCCHGRPWRWGVRYGAEHADAGFPPYLVGVRL